ncbi:MAG: PqqD family protein [Candidatus Geothermarchaeales archaeon]
MERLSKKGRLGKTREGEPLLVNEEGKEVMPDQIAVAIWRMCDGNVTSKDIVDAVVKRSNLDTAQVEEPVENLIEQLQKLSLLEKTG